MITIVELEHFRRRAEVLLSQAELDELFEDLARDPTIGDLIPGLGGVRKLRLGIQGRGKRGGARAIYYYNSDGVPLLAIYLYAKNEKVDLSPLERAAVLNLVDQIKRKARR